MGNKYKLNPKEEALIRQRIRIEEEEKQKIRQEINNEFLQKEKEIKLKRRKRTRTWKAIKYSFYALVIYIVYSLIKALFTWAST